MTDVQTVRRAAKRLKAEKKPKPADPVVTAVERLSAQQEAMLMAVAKKDEGVLELVQEALKTKAPEVTVQMDVKTLGQAVGEAVGKELEKHRAQPRERGSYYVTFDKNRAGETLGARIDPVEAKS